VQLSNDLKALHAGAMELSRGTREQVASVRDVLGEDRLAGAGGLADRFLGELQGDLSEAEGRARMLEHGCEAMGRLRAHGRQIERVASLLDVSGYGFAVESARSGASQRAFDTFVTELRKLAGRVRTLGETIAEQAESARAESEQLGRAIGTSLAGLGELTAQAEAAVRQTSERVESVLDRSWTVLQEAERHTARIATHAGEAVYHLQFGDIVRQKLEHIEAAVGDALPEYRDQVLPVQAGQLDLVVEEISSSRRQLERAFAGLAEETRLLVGIIAQFAGVGRGGGSKGPDAGRDPMEELRAAFLKIEELRVRGRQLCARAGETSARVMGAAAILSRHLAEVEEINQQMHLQALNAIVKTSLLGGAGRTLEILSMHVHGVFEESTALVKETVGAIENISRNAAECAAPVNQDTDTNAALRQRLDRLGSVQNEFRQTMESAGDQAGQQESRLERAHVSLEFLSAMERDVAELRGSVAAAVRSVASSRKTLPVAGAAPALGGRYTIASEREVHRRITGGAEPARPGASAPGNGTMDDNNASPCVDRPTPAPAPAGDDELGDNVELF
jgi:hypothetical protein